MPETFHVSLDKESLVFSAAHFITYQGDVCERLHGHNYRVTAEVEGPLDENQYVVDFILLRDTLQALIAPLDHRMLLPLHHKLIRVEPKDREVTVTFRERRWVFPLGDCVLLPVANTAAELLARHLGEQLLEKLHGSLGFHAARLRVGVDENHGQWGVWEMREA